MPNYVFNHLHVHADAVTARQIFNEVGRGDHIVADVEERIVDYTPDLSRLVFHYITNYADMLQVERFAKRFPTAYIVIHVHDNNGAFEGFAEFRDGKEIYGRCWEDCGGA